MENRGKFVTFEGGEGVGKSTQLKLLKEYLEATGQSAVFTREPGGNEISEKIRDIILNPDLTNMVPMCETMLYAASRAQVVDEVILPYLRAGELVICDRFIDSSVAYQGNARGIGIDAVLEINKYAIQGCMPDLTIFIDLPPDRSFRSKAKSAQLNDRLEHESDEFYAKVYEGYRKMIALAGDRIVTVQPCEDKYETSARIIAALRDRGIIR